MFNDAVCSIAITLLVLDIELPLYQVYQERCFGPTLRYLVPDFISFFC
ncbi:TMEM175 family protein [Patiriisocius sp. Uisw_017]